MALKITMFIDKAYGSVANMYEAMKALDQGTAAVQALGTKWGISLSQAEAQDLVDEFKVVQTKPICELRETKFS